MVLRESLSVSLNVDVWRSRITCFLEGEKEAVYQGKVAEMKWRV
jgi:hypothetical protein